MHVKAARGLALLAAALGLFSLSARAQEPAAPQDPEGVEFFEHKIRPVLAERCFSCHSEKAEKVKGKLLLDSRDGLRAGGESGPALLPGDPERSLLIKAIRYADDSLKMPPKSPLSPAQVADFEAWVQRGAPDPRTKGPIRKVADPRAHWAFRLPKDVAPPEVRRKEWVKNGVDAFILAKLEAKGMEPQVAADKRTLIRRATLDLLGVPPKPDEVDAFLADDSADAFAKVVDRLLASPLYGERYGRHWLDHVRYADTKGWQGDGDRRFPYSYTYRDWVIRAFNEDLPYDRFLELQIAADRLVTGDDRRDLAALGFLTLGRRDVVSVHDIIEDQIDVTSRSMLGLTVGCARCHDHKYDPIPTRDYYSLYGIFASASEPPEPPRIGAALNQDQSRDFENQLRAKQGALVKFREDRLGELLPALRSAKMIQGALLAAQESRDVEDPDQLAAIADKYGHKPLTVERWRAFLKKAADDRNAVFFAWTAYAALPEKEFGPGAAAVKVEGPAAVAAAFATPPATLREAADRYAALLTKYDKAETLPDAHEEAMRLCLRGPGAPTNIPASDVEKIMDAKFAQELGRLKHAPETLKLDHPGSPPCAMTILDKPQPVEPRVFIRGNPATVGDPVPRRFLSVLTAEGREPFREGSGRLELARAIAARENPLAARVLVNRIWLHHFGAGIVRTPSDFGTRGDSPSHPELLDWLALRFSGDMNWSIKQLHRLILLSATYQQACRDNPTYRIADPGNRLLWKMNRQRLDFEAMRDSLLSVSGQLDLTTGGRPVLWSPTSSRRSVYLQIDRQNIPGTFRDFDVASPNAHTPMRYTTTVPQQALFLMNSEFIIEQARRLAARPEIESKKDPEGRIRQLYSILFGRSPSADEILEARRFVGERELLYSAAMADPARAWQYGSGSFDEGTQRVVKFARFPIFTRASWRLAEEKSDPKSERLLLTADGGHPGKSRERAAIRRWTAPREGVVSIFGTLRHVAAEGDGVRARIVSSSLGPLAWWKVQAAEVETRISRVVVKAGDTIDFAVECGDNDAADAFTWAPTLRMDPPGEGPSEWSATLNFGGPARKMLRPWQSYAQVLLLTHEFMFVD